MLRYIINYANKKNNRFVVNLLINLSIFSFIIIYRKYMGQNTSIPKINKRNTVGRISYSNHVILPLQGETVYVYAPLSLNLVMEILTMNKISHLDLIEDVLSEYEYIHYLSGIFIHDGSCGQIFIKCGVTDYECVVSIKNNNEANTEFI